MKRDSLPQCFSTSDIIVKSVYAVIGMDKLGDEMLWVPIDRFQSCKEIANENNIVKLPGTMCVQFILWYW